MGKDRLVESMPKNVKRQFTKWLKKEKFDLCEISVDDAIALIFERSDFDVFGKYQMQLNRGNHNLPVIEIVDDNNKAYSLIFGRDSAVHIAGRGKYDEMFKFKSDFKLEERVLQEHNNSVDIRVGQSPRGYTMSYFDDDIDRQVFIDVNAIYSSIYGHAIDEVMDYVKKTAERNHDFLGLCGELCNFSLFDAWDHILVTRRMGAISEPEDILLVEKGKLQRLSLTTDNRQIDFDGENETWTLRTGENFVVSKREIETEDEFNYLYHSDGLTCKDLEHSLTPSQEIEMCESEVDEAVSSFQKIFRPNRTSEYNYYFSSKDPCFVAGTLIMTDSRAKPIESIKENDLVLSYNVDTKETELKRVVKTFIKQSDEIHQISVGGEVIKTTAGHVFYVNGEWKSVRDIKHGDKLMDSNKNIMEVDNIQIVQSDGTQVYNFEVEDNHNYFVGSSNILVHNECELQW